MFQQSTQEVIVQFRHKTQYLIIQLQVKVQVIVERIDYTIIILSLHFHVELVRHLVVMVQVVAVLTITKFRQNHSGKRTQLIGMTLKTKLKSELVQTQRKRKKFNRQLNCRLISISDISMMPTEIQPCQSIKQVEPVINEIILRQILTKLLRIYVTFRILVLYCRRVWTSRNINGLIGLGELNMRSKSYLKKLSLK